MKSQTDLPELVIITLQSNKCSKDSMSGAQLVCNCEYFKCCVCLLKSVGQHSNTAAAVWNEAYSGNTGRSQAEM